MPLPMTIEQAQAQLVAIYDAAVEKKNAEVQAIVLGAWLTALIALDTVKYQP